MAMQPAVKEAAIEWCSGLIVGLIPLAAHGICSAIGDATTTPGDWSVDVIFIAITTSGLSVVNVFNRMRKGSTSVSGKPHLLVLMALTVLIVIVAAVIYGLVASGHAHSPLTYAILVLISSAIASIYFDVAMARPQQGPVAGAPA